MKATKPLAQPLAAKLPARRSSALRQVGLVKPLTKPLVRPLTRADCEDGERPCPWATCRYHLAGEYGDQRKTDPAKGVNVSTRPSCALDVADNGPMSEPEIAKLLDISQPRVSQLLTTAIRRAKAAGNL